MVVREMILGTSAHTKATWIQENEGKQEEAQGEPDTAPPMAAWLEKPAEHPVLAPPRDTGLIAHEYILQPGLGNTEIEGIW